jgi:hypothetical protein
LPWAQAVETADHDWALAMEMPDRYGVRALDAIQLAAALVWCRERPNRRPFVCFDGCLSKGAADAGFSVRT